MKIKEIFQVIKGGMLVFFRMVSRIDGLRFLRKGIDIGVISITMAVLLDYYFQDASQIRENALAISGTLFTIIILFWALDKSIFLYSHSIERKNIENTKRGDAVNQLFYPTDNKRSEEYRRIHEFEKRVIKAHEVGHALAVIYFTDYDFSLKCSFPGCEGSATTIAQPNAFLQPKQIKDLLFIKYAGAAAEEVIFGFFTTGSMGSERSDFVTANEMLSECLIMTEEGIGKTAMENDFNEKMVTLSYETYKETLNFIKGKKDELKYLAEKLEFNITYYRMDIEKMLSERRLSYGVNN